MPRLILRVVDTEGTRRNSLALKQADALFPSASPMLGAGQRDLDLHRDKK
ncbi:MAG: hypothetical protein PVF97_08430 [Desulfobacterales bacterium]|jgi:hypothetical protein